MVFAFTSKVLRITLITLFILVAGLFGVSLWLSQHYKRVLGKHLPAMLENSTDGMYHITFSDVDINLFDRTISVINVKLWPDTNRVNILRSQHRKTPNTLLTLTIPRMEADGVQWENITSERSVDLGRLVVHDIKWMLVNTPHPQDTLLNGKEAHKPFINKITATSVQLINPDVTYSHHSPSSEFSWLMKGGNITVKDWIYSFDEKEDTSLFLFAHGGSVRLHSFTIQKAHASYLAVKPVADFTTTSSGVIFHDIRANNVVKTDRDNGYKKEIYDINFPKIELNGFNWKKLINSNKLYSSQLSIRKAAINITHYQEYDEKQSLVGSYPSQLLEDIELKINIKTTLISATSCRVTTVTKEKGNNRINYTGIRGEIVNLTNVPQFIQNNSNCAVKLSGRFMAKGELSINVNFTLGNKAGKFSADGYVKDLSSEDVTSRAKTFSTVAITNFHLTRMNFHIVGDEVYSKGNFTILYEGLKLSLLKFEGDKREGTPKGPFALLANGLVLYPDNPMPGEEIRSVATSLVREPDKGFINQLGAHVFLAAKKTVLRNEQIINLAEGRDAQKKEKPHKGFFKRLFNKKK